MQKISSYVRRRSHFLFDDDDHVVATAAIVGRGVAVVVVFFCNPSDSAVAFHMHTSLNWVWLLFAPFRHSPAKSEAYFFDSCTIHVVHCSAQCVFQLLAWETHIRQHPELARVYSHYYNWSTNYCSTLINARLLMCGRGEGLEVLRDYMGGIIITITFCRALYQALYRCCLYMFLWYTLQFPATTGTFPGGSST